MAIIVRKTPAKAYEDIMADLASVHFRALEYVAALQAATSSEVVLRAHEYLIAKRDALAQRASTRGLPAYARAQEDDPAYDVATEWAATRAAIQSAIDFVEANFPRSTFLTFDPTTDKPTYQVIPAGQLTALRTAMQAIADSIDISEL